MRREVVGGQLERVRRQVTRNEPQPPQGELRPLVEIVEAVTPVLFDRKELAQVWKLRRVLLALESGASLELLIDRLKNSNSNEEFLADVAKSGN